MARPLLGGIVQRKNERLWCRELDFSRVKAAIWNSRAQNTVSAQSRETRSQKRHPTSPVARCPPPSPSSRCWVVWRALRRARLPFRWHRERLPSYPWSRARTHSWREGVAQLYISLKHNTNIRQCMLELNAEVLEVTDCASRIVFDKKKCHNNFTVHSILLLTMNERASMHVALDMKFYTTFEFWRLSFSRTFRDHRIDAKHVIRRYDGRRPKSGVTSHWNEH